MKNLTILTVPVLACLAATAWSQNTQKRVKSVPAPYSDPASGAQMYKDYCASCHGLQGDGNGPAAPYLKSRPTDLSTLAQRNHGKYPWRTVHGTLKFGPQRSSHGPIDMPIWGDLFQSRFGVADLRAANLVKYVESIQR